MVQAVDESR